MHALAKLGYNESFNKRLVECFLSREARDLCSLIVPFVYIAVHVYAKDRGIRRIDQLTQLASHGCNCTIVLRRLRNILSDTDHANNIILGISTGGGVDK